MPKKTAEPPQTRQAEYAALVWRISDPVPRKLWFDDPLAALTAAVEYLKDGYQARLSDTAVEHFRGLPQADPELRQAARLFGQHAALTGPPDHRAGD